MREAERSAPDRSCGLSGALAFAGGVAGAGCLRHTGNCPPVTQVICAAGPQDNSGNLPELFSPDGQLGCVLSPRPEPAVRAGLPRTGRVKGRGVAADHQTPHLLLYHC